MTSRYTTIHKRLVNILKQHNNPTRAIAQPHRKHHYTSRRGFHSSTQTKMPRHLYHHEMGLTQHSTTLSSIEPLSAAAPEIQALFKNVPPEDAYLLSVPSTIFHPQGGGQPADRGTLTFHPQPSPDTPTGTPSLSSPVEVHHVRSATFTSAPLHAVSLSPSALPGPGTALTQTLSIPHRIYHSRLHTAGHLLGLAVRKLVERGELPPDVDDARGKAAHFPGQAWVECQGLIPGTAREAIEKEVNVLVDRDVNVRVEWWDAPTCEARGVKDVLWEAFTEEPGMDEEERRVARLCRVVDVEGCGAYMCGGTHVRGAREVGRIVVRSVKRSKGVSRISYDLVEGLKE